MRTKQVQLDVYSTTSPVVNKHPNPCRYRYSPTEPTDDMHAFLLLGKKKNSFWRRLLAAAAAANQITIIGRVWLEEVSSFRSPPSPMNVCAHAVWLLPLWTSLLVPDMTSYPLGATSHSVSHRKRSFRVQRCVVTHEGSVRVLHAGLLLLLFLNSQI